MAYKIAAVVAILIIIRGLAFSQAVAPIKVLAVKDAHYPDNTFMRGEVSFEVTVGSSGRVQKINPVRDVPPLTQAALQSLKGWVFAPGKLDGRPIASAISVAFVFSPGTPHSPQFPATVAPSDPLMPTGNPPQLPVRIEQWTDARNPSWLRFGAVALEATVGANGRLGRVTVLRELGPGTREYTAAARAALAKWRFKPAEINGDPVASRIAVAFVFGLPWPLAPKRTSISH